MRDFFKKNLFALGQYTLIVVKSFYDIVRLRFSVREVSLQIIRIGVLSLPIIVLTAMFTGMVLALQTAYGLQRFGAKNYVGNIVGLSLLRELGPVLSAIMVCGRVGAAVAAEIGSMAVTEQIDALRSMGASPITKLVTPRLLAGLIAMPVLVIIADIVGIYGGLLVAVYELNITSHMYITGMLRTVWLADLQEGLIKSFFFGFLVITIASYRGLVTTGGTTGVGRATNEAVVIGSIAIFISDYFLTKILILLNW
ncbi:MAG: ABC transporter permease [Candidatus Dadabacteria bacterium]|nr:MAG: ABC transporter permease [Candidatus Dadabacteria bacterium]